MIPTVAIPQYQYSGSVLSNGPSASLPAYVAPSSLTYGAVPVSVSSGQVYNNSKAGAINASNITTSSLIASSPLTGSTAQISIGSHGVSSGFSTLFMAQIFAQESSSNQTLASSFLSNPRPTSPTVTPELLQHFSMVKYFPSNAAKPQPQPQGTAAILEANRALQQQAQTQIRELTQQSPSSIQQIAQTSPQAAMVQPIVRISVATAASQNAQPARSTNSIRHEGVGAYVAAQARSSMSAKVDASAETSTDL